MASSHSSSPVPQSTSSDAFFKKEMDTTKCFRPVQSLPDVCPKEPTGNVGVKESENAVKFANPFTIVQSNFLVYWAQRAKSQSYFKVCCNSALYDPVSL